MVPWVANLPPLLAPLFNFVRSSLGRRIPVISDEKVADNKRVDIKAKFSLCALKYCTRGQQSLEGRHTSLGE